MDREKLKEAAIDYSTYTDSDDYDVTTYDAFMDGIDWLMQQPLSERLTEEEKEKILKWYNNAQKDSHSNTIDGVIKKMVALIVMGCLVDIFGTDLFKDK